MCSLTQPLNLPLKSCVDLSIQSPTCKLLVLYMAKRKETYMSNLAENPFFHPHGNNFTLVAKHKQIVVILFVHVT